MRHIPVSAGSASDIGIMAAERYLCGKQLVRSRGERRENGMLSLPNQKGQAMAEYHVIFSVIIVLSFAILWLAGGGLSDLYADAVNFLLGVFVVVP